MKKLMVFIGVMLMAVGLVMAIVFSPIECPSKAFFFVMAFPIVGFLLMVAVTPWTKRGWDIQRTRDSANLEEIRYYEQMKYLSRGVGSPNDK